MKRITVLTMLTALLALWTIAAGAGAPQLVNFQGILRDGSGNPVANGNYSVTFKIYDAAVGGATLWTESQTVTTSGGLFTALLGSNGTPVPDAAFSDTTRYLGITVSPDPEMTPRQRLVSVGYGYRVNSVDEASGGDVRSNLRIDGSLTSGNSSGTAGNVFVTNGTSTLGVMDGSDGADGGAVIKLDNSSNATTLTLDADDITAGDFGAILTMSDGTNTTITLDALSGTSGAFFSMKDGTTEIVHLDANGVNGGAQFSLREGDLGLTTISLDAESGVNGGARVALTDGVGSTTIVLDGDATGTSAVVVPDGAIDSSEIKDEPGVASTTATAVFNLLDNTVHTLLSRSITTPAGGYVLVIGTVEVRNSHSSCDPVGFDQEAYFGVSDVAGSFPPNQAVRLRLPCTTPSGTYSFPVTVHGLFSVGAGVSTFYLLGEELSDDYDVFDRQLTLIYFPTRYGTVTPTLASSIQNLPDENPDKVSAVMPKDVPDGRVQAEAFSNARIEKELAQMKTERALLEERLQKLEAQMMQRKGLTNDQK